MNSLYYFKEEIGKHLELTGDPATDARNYHKAVENGNKALKAIRQRGKAPSFGMQYGAFPPKIAESIKCTLEEAEQIFDRYHNELYPGVTSFRENTVEPIVKKTGKIHAGLGFYLHTDNPSKDVRTLVNFCSQFWSILTLLAINEIHRRIDNEGKQNDIKCIATIYDSVYFTVKEDAETLKFLNDNIVKIMCKDFIENQTVPLEATAEIGRDWADMHQIPNNATQQQIQEHLDDLR
jgi:DNA polymerase I-like protein with 3'-5' exonuclease and polymerase domains